MDTLDYARQYENIKKSALSATEKMFPIDGKDKLLRTTRVWVDDDLDPTDYAGQKEAKLKDKTWGSPVRADFELVDKVSGKVVEREKGVRLFMLPKATARMSFIVGGNEYQVDNQLRRKPGIYTIRSQGGDGDLRTEFNVAGQKLDLIANQKTGVIRMKSLRGDGVPLYPVLSRLGVSDGAMAKAWGEDVFAANKTFRSARHDQYVRQAAKNLGRTGVLPGSATEATEIIRKRLSEMEVDPVVNKKTIGDESPRVEPTTLLAASKNLIDVQFHPESGKLPVERDSLQYKQLLSVEDFVKERLEKKLPDAKRKFTSKLNLRKDQKIRDVVDLSILNPTVESFFTQTDLSHSGEQTNPLQILNAISRVTLLGEGGAKAGFSITPEAKALHPTHLGFLDPVHTPESEHIGSTLHLTLGARKRGREITTPVIDAKTGKHVEVTPLEMSESVVTFPDQYDARTRKFKEKEVKVLRDGKHSLASAAEVKYVLADPKQAFSVSTNLVPFLHSNSGGRALMAAKMLEQAIPLVEREAPLVQNKIRDTTFEKAIGEGFSHHSPVAGTVKSVGKSIVVTDKTGDHEVNLYDNFPLNGKAFMHSEPSVKVGDVVKKGQLIADTNYTRDGTLAIGTNLRTVYVPYLGKNFEDGIAISEGAAKKLSSEHLYPKFFRRQEHTEFDRDKFAALFPGVFSREQLGRLDSDGVVKKGQVVEPGDPILAAVKHLQITQADQARGRASIKALRPERSAEETWNGITTAKVVDVVKGTDGVKVYMRTVEPAQIGDKLTGRYGNKGVIVAIVPDKEAPRVGGVNGEPAEVILNPTGIITRMNVGQMLETAASKIAVKNGGTYDSDNFVGTDATKKVRADLAKNGLSDTDELYDPATNKNLGRVLSGKQYMLKLTKQAGTMFSARSWGQHTSGYDINKTPLHGGEEGSKALDLLTMYAMLSHGAKNNLREMDVIKSQQNDDFWRAYESGRTLPTPKPTFAYNKFISYLKGAGINVESNGSKQILVPMTDREVGNLSSGAITEPLFVRRKDLAPEVGGFFDQAATGGLPDRSGEGGEKWSHIQLAEPVPNPVMEAPIRTLLNLDKAKFSGIVGGDVHWDAAKGVNTDGVGVTGGTAIKAMLAGLDVETMLKDATNTSKTTKSQAKLDASHKIIRYLRAIKESGRKPDELYVQSKIPVIPPVFRPLHALPSGDLTVEGPNRLYQHVAMLNNQLAWQNSVPYITDKIKADVRSDLYKSVSALSGLTQPLGFFPDKRRPSGFIELVKGKGQSKDGFFQRKVMRREQDLVGRGTIISDPKLGADEVSLPQDMAWAMFKPFVVRGLVMSRGYAPADATQAWEERSPIARSVLDQVMEDRPVLLNRPPSLHKFSIMAFKPRMNDDPNSKTIKIPPIVVKGFNADLDGDTMSVHVPVLDGAVEEAKRMFPSRNIYSPGTGSLMLEPRQEALVGLSLLSKDPTDKNPKASLKNIDEVEIAINRGALKYNDVIELGGESTTAGRALINRHLPVGIKLDSELDKTTASKLYRDIAEKNKDGYANIIDRLRQLGDTHAYRSGFSVSLADAEPDLPEKDQVFREAHAQVAAFRRTGASQEAVDDNVKKVFGAAEKKVRGILESRLKQQGNRFNTMVTTGARGNMTQLMQIVSAPVLVRDHRDNTIPTPVTTSYSKGMPLSDYWVTLYGARAGAMDRQLQTSKPGAFTKDVMAAAVSNLISKEDCGDDRGLTFDLKRDRDLREVNDRFLAQDVLKDGKTYAHHNDLITPKLTADLLKHGVTNINVRSPLTCLSPHGICALDYGLHEDGRLPQVGDNIGAISGQAMSEPLTQLTMSTFHSGSVAGTGLKLSTFDKIDRLMSLRKRLPGKATLADVAGRVDSIHPSTTKGGSNVLIGGVEHFVPKSLSMLVRVGSNVGAGDAISEGIISPQELLDRKKELLPALEYMAKEVTNAYQSERVPLRQRAVETVVRTIGSLTKIVDPGSSPYAPGELAPYQAVQAFNRTTGHKAIGEALGHILVEDSGPVKAGTKIDKNVQKILASLGKQRVKVSPDPIIHEPQIFGIKALPLMRSDWMSQLGYNHIKDALLGGTANRSESDISGYSPIPAFAYGATFGEGENGAY